MRTIQLRRLFERAKVLGHSDEPMLSVFREHGVVLKDSLTNHNQTAEDRSIYQLVDDGWLVVNRMKAWQGSVGVSSLRGIVSGHYICFRPQHSEDDRFLHYLLRSPRMTAVFLSISRGVRPGQIEIDNDDLAAVKLELPEVEQQRRIADLLDDRVGRIDRIIAARRKQSAVLAAVLQSDLQSLQDRLSERFGDTRLGHLIASIEQGWSPQADGIAAEENEWGVVRSGCVNGGVFRPADNKRLPGDLRPRPEYEINDGDLLMSRASGSLDLIGSVAVVPPNTRRKLLLCDKIYRIIPTSDWNPTYFAHMLRTHRSREQIRVNVSGAEGMANNLPAGAVRDLRIPVAPQSDQRDTVEAADQMARTHHTAAIALVQSIGLLTEYKSSLITAAVTGELDITASGSGIPT